MKYWIARIAVFAILVIGGWLCLRGCKPKPPPAEATRAETTVVYRDGETRTIVNYRTDPALSKELEKLRADLDGKQSTIDKLKNSIVDGTVLRTYLVDSISRAMLDSVRGIVRVVRGPAGFTATTYERGEVQDVAFRVWRNRWKLLAGKTKPTIEQSWLPVDFGFACGGGLTTPPDTWVPQWRAFAGLTVRRQAVTAFVGPEFDGRLRLRGEWRYEWRW